MDSTTNHQQHQDGSPILPTLQQPPPPSKKRKQHQVKKFEQRMDNLREYKEKHGHVNVKKSDDTSLYGFCSNMRRARKHPEKSNAVLNEERIASLDALGFEWTVKKQAATKKSPFEKRMDDLREFKEKHGHVNVKKSEDESLYGFCKNIRKARNNPEKSDRALTDDRIASLDAVGFDWTVREYAAKKSFEQRMDDLRAYKEKHGHIYMKKSDDKSLYAFCCDIRYARKNPEKSNMVLTDDRIASLDTLGFDWSAKEEAANKLFAQRIEDLRSYKEKHGHINVRKSDDKSLYTFCINVRHARKNPEKSGRTLTDDRIASLDALGFDWSNRHEYPNSFAQQTDRPKPSKKRKQKGQGKVHTATKKRKKKHVSSGD